VKRALLGVVLLCLVAVRASAEGAVNLNTAGEGELIRLPGIGPVLAKRIVAYRTQSGTFRTVDELTKVKGIGARRLAQLRSLVTLGPGAKSVPAGLTGKTQKKVPGEVQQRGAAKVATGGAAARQEARQEPVDLNTAPVDALCALPGVGPKTAAAIIDDRQQRGPFTSVDDLARVKGIGPKKLERIRPFAAVSKGVR